jgi:long-chain fatty acid transport protein
MQPIISRGQTLNFAAAAILGATPLTLLAGGMRLASQDAFATARGEAFVATADNPSAIHYNPAGLTQLEGGHLRGGIYGIYFDPTFTPPRPANTNTFHIEKQTAAAPQLFCTYTPRDSILSGGLGIYAPYGGAVRWPQDTGFRAVAIESKLTYLTVNPAAALKLGPNFSVGVGLMVNYARLKLEQGLLRYEEPLPNFFRFEGDGWSAGYNLGVLWRPHEKLSLGATFRGAAPLSFKGSTEFEQFPIIPVTERSASTEFTFPLGMVVGVSWRPTPQWNLEFNADYTDWSSFHTNYLKQAPPPWPVRQVVPIAFNWQSSWMYEFGVTRYFENGWHASAGYVFSENSVRDVTYTPLAPDLDRHFATVGVGFKGKRYSLDLAYQFGYGPDRTVSGSTASSTPGRNAGQNADGTYDFISHALLVTVGRWF